MKGDKFLVFWVFVAIGLAGLASDAGTNIWAGVALAVGALGAMFMAARSAM